MNKSDKRATSPFNLPAEFMSSSLLNSMGGSSSNNSTAPGSQKTSSNNSSAPGSHMPAPPPARKPIPRGSRRQSALLMEQLTRELDRQPRSSQSQDSQPYQTISDLITGQNTNLGPTGRSGSMTLSALSSLSGTGSRPGSFSTVQANSGTFSTERGSGSRRRSRRLSGESTSFLSDFAYAMGEDTSSRRESLAMFTDLLDPTALEDLKRRSSMYQGFDMSLFSPRTSALSNNNNNNSSSSSSSSNNNNNNTSYNKRKAPRNTLQQKKGKKPKRTNNRSFEALRRTRVNNAMKQLKKVCLRETKSKSGTKIEVLEMAIGLLAKVRGQKCMDFQGEYDKADAGVDDEITQKASASGAHDIRRSIRERKRRVKVNILEKELSRLALATEDSSTRSGASKCQILERACAALGDPVTPMSDEDE